MDQLLKKLVLSGIGVLVLTQEKIEEVVEELAKKGEIAWGEKEGLLAELIEKGTKQREEIERKIKKKVEEVISQINIATKEDIKRLEKKIDELKKKKP